MSRGEQKDYLLGEGEMETEEKSDEQTADKLFSKVKKALQHLEEEVVVYPEVEDQSTATNNKKANDDKKD